MDNSLLVELCEQSHSLDRLRWYMLKSGALLVVSRKMDAIQTSSSGHRELREIDASQDQGITSRETRPSSTFVTDESPHSRHWNLSDTLSAKEYSRKKGLALTSLNRIADIHIQQTVNGKVFSQYFATVLAGFLNNLNSSNSVQVMLLCSQYTNLRDCKLREQLIRYTLSQHIELPLLLLVKQENVHLELYRCTKGGLFLWQNKL